MTATQNAEEIRPSKRKMDDRQHKNQENNMACRETQTFIRQKIKQGNQ